MFYKKTFQNYWKVFFIATIICYLSWPNICRKTKKYVILKVQNLLLESKKVVLKNELSTKINMDKGIIKNLNVEGFKNILVLTGPKNSLKIFEDNIKNKIKTNFYVYSHIATNASENDIYNIVNFARNKKIDLILSVGGGTVMDCGRMVSLLLSHGGMLHEYVPGGTLGTMSITPNLVYHITVPTISGTGAEISSVATFKRANKKFIITSPFLSPNETYIDPTLMVNIPKQLWSTIVFTGFTRAIEAYVSTLSTFASDMFAEEALKTYVPNIKDLLKNPNDLGTINKIVVASLNSLIAHNLSSAGAISAIASSLSANLNLHQGTALATVCAQVCRENYEYNKPKFNKIIEMFNSKEQTIFGTLTKFIKDCEVILPSVKHRLTVEIMDQIIADSMGENMFGNPKEFTVSDVLNVLKSLE